MKGWRPFVKLAMPVVWLMLIATSAYAAELKVEGNRLYVSGRLDNKENGVLEQTLSNAPQVNTIVFRKCLGGQLGAAQEYVRVIGARGLNTLVSDQCHSACAIAFLAGRQRGPVDKVGTHMVGLHLSRGKDGTPAPPHVNIALLAQITKLTRGKLDDGAKKLLTTSTSETSGVFFVASNYKIWVRNRVYYCDGKQGNDVSKCQLLPDVDPYTSGIFTAEQ